MPARERKKPQISRDPKDLDDPKNMPFLYEGPDGDRFIDWENPGHVMEKWTDRLKVLATGTPEEIETVFRDEYYNRLVKKLDIGPDAGKRSNKKIDDNNITLFPERRPMIDADEAMSAMRGLKKEVMRLTRERQLLALHAAQMGCPENADPDCEMAMHPPKERATAYCMRCWLKYAEDTIVKPGRQKIVPGTKNA